MIKTKLKKTGKYLLRALYVFLITLAFVLIFLLGGIAVLVKGPSSEAKSLFVQTVKETSAAGFLAHIFLSDDEVNEIIARSDVEDYEVDTSLIRIEHSGSYVTHDRPVKDTSVDTSDETGQSSAAPEEKKDLEVVEVKGNTYKGTLMIVRDPSRVILGTPDAYGSDKYGLVLREMCKKHGAVGGINAGGFYDVNGSGTGGIPDGIVIKDGELMWGQPSTTSTVIGFDKNNVLRVGWMSAQNALDLGMRDACSFGPALIVNGRPMNEKYKLGGGVNPRTAIGQTSDGTVLLLVIDGRSISSLGVTYDDLIDIMLSYGAVNAANLDGGSSTLMVYNGETVNSSAYLFGERILATAFLVK